MSSTPSRIIYRTSPNGKGREGILRTFLWDNPTLKKVFKESQARSETHKEEREKRLAEIRKAKALQEERSANLAELRKAKEAWLASKKA